MAYRVIHRFYDSMDNSHVYAVGDEYPRKGHKPTKKRIEELTKVHHLHKVAFIEEIKDKE